MKHHDEIETELFARIETAPAAIFLDTNLG